MRFTNKTMKKILGILSVLVMMIGMMTASGLQASAASADIARISLSETAKALTNGYVSDSVMGILVFIIILLVLALVAVVVVILVITNKNKNDNNIMPNQTNVQNYHQAPPMNRPMNQPMNPSMQQPVNRPMNQPTNPAMQQPMNPAMNQPMNEEMDQQTSRPKVSERFMQNGEIKPYPVDGAGDTTVLGTDSSGYVLMRKNGSEKVLINKPEFYIGKERAKVDYCITNNNSISRRHAKIKVRAGKCYISDLGSTNSTYINGTKLSPNQEVALIPGDKVKLSNEEFEFIG